MWVAHLRPSSRKPQVKPKSFPEPRALMSHSVNPPALPSKVQILHPPPLSALTDRAIEKVVVLDPAIVGPWQVDYLDDLWVDKNQLLALS